jgi:polyisoprenyl-teichoic acid--peptidoglycan teichoic acid transferase
VSAASTATSPIRYPDTSSSATMGKRAWWLVGLGVLIPGSAQLLAGDRRLGRFAVSTTFIFWALAVVALALFGFWRTGFLTLATNVIALSIIQVVLAFYAILWVVLGVDTLRLVRLVRLAPIARVAVAMLAAVALVATVGVAGYGAVVAGSARGLLTGVFGGTHYAAPIDGRYNVLLLGGDAGADRIGLRPDSISVVSIDAASGASTIVGIPRNLENNIPLVADSPLLEEFPNGYNCGNDCLISYLYTYGHEHPDLYPDALDQGSDPGVEAMRDAVEAVTGLTMQYYVLIDMQGFSQMIDALGGVTIDVQSKVLLGKNGNDPIGSIPAGVQTMDGATALWYARSRYNVTDYDRMLRQRDVQEAILGQFEPANVLTKFQAVAEAGSQVVKTDIPSSMLPLFVELGQKAKTQPITTVELVPPTVITANPDIPAIQALIAAALAKSTASPAPTP